MSRILSSWSPHRRAAAPHYHITNTNTNTNTTLPSSHQAPICEKALKSALPSEDKVCHDFMGAMRRASFLATLEFFCGDIGIADEYYKADESTLRRKAAVGALGVLALLFFGFQELLLSLTQYQIHFLKFMNFDFLLPIKWNATFYAVLMATVAILMNYAMPAGEEKDRALISEFMEFQDWLEDATAKGATMPKFISRNFIWGPVRSERERITARLAVAIQRAVDARSGPGKIGPWLRALLNDATLGKGRERMVIIADLLIGLLFAAHKNAAIGAGQTLCFLMENDVEQVPHKDRTWLRLAEATCHDLGFGSSELNGCIKATLEPQVRFLNLIPEQRESSVSTDTKFESDNQINFQVYTTTCLAISIPRWFRRALTCTFAAGYQRAGSMRERGVAALSPYFGCDS